MAKKKAEGSLKSLEAERSVLGGLINAAVQPDEVLGVLTQEAFTNPDHQALFRLIGDLYRTGQTPDLVTISDRFEKDQLVAGIASIFYPDSVHSHLETVRDLAIRRQVQQKCMEIHEKISNRAQPAGALLDSAQRSLSRITQGATRDAGIELKEGLYEAIEEIESQPEKGIAGIPTGYRRLDSILAGLQPTNLTILAARPRMGKTALASNILINAASQGYPCAIFSLEMSRTQLIKRMLSQISRVSFQKIRTGTLSREELDALHVGAERLYRLDVWIDDSPALTSYEIKSRARSLYQKRGIKLIAVDYLQKCKTQRQAETRDQAVTEMSADFKDLAKELEIPVLCLAQLNRAVENRKKQRPVLSDLRESGGIEQEADDILFIYREAVYKESCGHNKAEIIVGKQRNGPEGTVELAFIGEHVSFEELSEEQP